MRQGHLSWCFGENSLEVFAAFNVVSFLVGPSHRDGSTKAASEPHSGVCVLQDFSKCFGHQLTRLGQAMLRPSIAGVGKEMQPTMYVRLH